VVSAAHKLSRDQPDVSLYGIWTIRTALEEQTDSVSNVATAAAALWLRNAASTIWDLSRQGKTFDGKVAKPGSLLSDQDWRGYSRDRWRAWEQRLVDIQGQVTDSDTADLVEQARRAMGDVVER
jgi:hypothetical protein